jgi:dTDP-4-dehydrorhamnose reductase
MSETLIGGPLTVAELALQTEAVLPRSTVIETMQDCAPAGLTNLSVEQEAGLRILTGYLVENFGDNAAEEYDRYINTKNRGLELDEPKLREQLTGKTVLVTGGTGLIGSELVAELARFSPGRLVSMSRGKTKPKKITDGVEYVYADVTDKDGVNEVMADIKPDIVYHLAAEKHPATAELEVKRTLQTNIFGTKNVLEAAEATGAQQIIYASTGKATRPYSPDTYASSKKGGEWLMSQAAQKTNMLVSGTRFTHVVDNSNIIQRIDHWVEEDTPIRLHSTDAMFYVQSAKESAHLLLNAGIDAQPGVLKLHALRNLDWPINLTDLAIGAVAKQNANTPIYFCGVEDGYEEQAWPGLYDPLLSGEVSPLINFSEAPQAQASATCPEVDVFPLEIESDQELIDKFYELGQACQYEDNPDLLREKNRMFSWAMLNSRLRTVPITVIERAAKRIPQHQAIQMLTDEHIKTNTAIEEILVQRQSI